MSDSIEVTVEHVIGVLLAARGLCESGSDQARAAPVTEACRRLGLPLGEVVRIADKTGIFVIAAGADNADAKYLRIVKCLEALEKRGATPAPQPPRPPPTSIPGPGIAPGEVAAALKKKRR